MLNAATARNGRRLLALLALAAFVPTAAGPLAGLAGAAARSGEGSEASYAHMPDPVSFDEPEVTLGRTTVRLSGVQMLYRIDTSTRKVENQRRINFGFASIYAAREQTEFFGGQPYIKLTGGRFENWWVRASSTAFGTQTQLSQSAQVRIKAGDHKALRFYASGAVKTRRAFDLTTATTFATSHRATFNSRTFYYLADGPLADRWVPSRIATLVTKSGDTSTTSTPTPTPTPTPSTSTAASWKGAVLIYRETDVTYTRSDGTDYRLQARMSDTMHSLVLNTVDRFRRSVNSWSGGLAQVRLDIVQVPHPLTSLDKFGSGYWVGPRAVEADLDRYAPTGSYDSILVIWQAKDKTGAEVPVGGWGLTLPPGSWSNNAGYSSVTTPSQMWWWTDSSAPEEVFVHEWMHQVIFWFEQAGLIKLDLHSGASYGYDASDGTWKQWLSDVMQGSVRDGNTYIGVDAKMWGSGKPTNP